MVVIYCMIYFVPLFVLNDSVMLFDFTIHVGWHKAKMEVASSVLRG